MPFRSKKQERTMEAAAHDPKFAKKMGIDQAGAKKFVKDSEGKPMAKKKGKK